ncbi:hypothetical protein EVG20_g347 [Dentipellis fragilis]|uniref:Ribosomal protein L30 ferredoxin-like fold domain-containing protein n=1 Tax=Dentipellis fragilis TaxID=205917 RepID=A0A4Y9ZF99_9AGAM|nr:hypothetical protein EVG20_g347 [Dentipellis fragilis]
MATPFSSPSKGKAKEEDSLHTGWWELHPLLECQDRPIAWGSLSSTIFTAHPTQPIIYGRLFPSSKQFTVPAPAPVLNAPTTYYPPTTLTISPDDRWLFAYYSSREGSGLGCFWSRGVHVNDWNLKEWWPFARGAGVVTSAWLGHTRQWSIAPSGHASRLPPSGPPTPCSDPTLFVVTQDLQANVIYYRTGFPSVRILRCSLTQPDEMQENLSSANMPSASSSSQDVKTCVRAAIGVMYGEMSIIVAMHSRVIPAAHPPAFSSSLDMHLSLNMDQTLQPSELTGSADWRHWGEEPTIELCEVRLGFDGVAMSLSSNPLPPQMCDSEQLCSIVLTPSKPSSLSNASSPNRPQMHLVASFVDFGDYMSSPKSELVVFSLTNSSLATSSFSPWLCRRSNSRKFSSDVVTFMSRHHPGSSSDALLTGTVSTSVVLPRRKEKPKEVPIGRLQVFQLPGLEDDTRWQTRPILAPSTESVLCSLPFNVAISPNDSLLCSISPPSLFPSKLSIHLMPRNVESTHIPTSAEDNSKTFSEESRALVAAIRSRRTVADVVHNLSSPLTTLHHVESILYETLTLLQEGKVVGPVNWHVEEFGLLVDVYRSRARQAPNPDIEELNSRWKAAQDLCSVAACANAFEDCKDGDQWLIDFLEQLMRECILFQEGSSVEDVKPGLTLPPIFLHLLHPHAFRQLRVAVSAVGRFYEYVKKLNPSVENAQIAKGILVDFVDCSGLNLKELEVAMVAAADDVMLLNGEDLRRSLASCRPRLSLTTALHDIVRRMVDSGAINRPRLFIKPQDFVTGVSNFELVKDALNDRDRDIVSKGLLRSQGHNNVCLLQPAELRLRRENAVLGRVDYTTHPQAMAAHTTVPTVSDIEVPETLLKKRKQNEKAREERLVAAAEARKAAKAKRKVLFKRAESYVKEYLTQEREEIRLKRAVRASGDFYVPAQPKVYFVVRIRGINEIAPKPRKILQLLRLLQINNGVFVRVTKATQQMLRLIEPYVTYGEPNLKTVRELIYKRGYGKVNKQRIPLSNNAVIEESLGKFDILSVEDLVHEIFTVGPNFKQASNFLWPFKLSNPTGGWRTRKFKHYVEGGDFGNREDNINKLIRQMN